jgi:hypothetical protein
MPLLSTRGANSAKGFGFTSKGKKAPTTVEYLVIAGGGSGGHNGGGGGAGGYRANVTGEPSGGGGGTQPSYTFTAGSGVTILSTGAVAAAPKLRAQYSSATLICKTGGATPTFYVVGDIS